MHALLLGARGAVGTVIRRELEREGHTVTAASRTADGDTGVDLRGDLARLSRLAGTHDVVVNASGVERTEFVSAVGRTPLVDISATGAYLEALRAIAVAPVVLGAGLVPGLSTILAAALAALPGDEIDILVMLGTGEQHGPAAVAWTAGLIGTDVYRPPEGTTVPNLGETLRGSGPDGRVRRYLRADFPDHILLDEHGDRVIRSYLTLSSAPMTGALRIIGRMPVLRGALSRTPHIGAEFWHVIARNRRTDERREASGDGQSEATGRLAAFAAVRIAATPEATAVGAVTMADLITPDEAREVLTGRR